MTIHPLRINIARALAASPPAALQAPDEAASHEGASDEVLILRIAAGDKRAMQALYGRHHLRLYRFVLRLVRDRQLAEDLISEAFLDVWRRASTFEARSAPSTWLMAIARFKALSALRRRGEAPLDDETIAATQDRADDPEVTLRKKQQGEILRDCLERLSLAHRETIDLVYYQGMGISEVAAIVGIPESTVKTRMFHARRQLSVLLHAAGVDRSWP